MTLRRIAPSVALIALIALAACASANPPRSEPKAHDAALHDSAPVRRADAATHVAPEESVPHVRLPADTRPDAETIVLRVDPREDRFSGSVDIRITLDHPRDVVWLHGKGLHVTRAVVTSEHGVPKSATWAQRDDNGVASLAVPGGIPEGRATVHIEYDAAFGTKGDGLYKVVQGGIPYAFTQFESIWARNAFPCFDEPGIKIPFDTTLIVPTGEEAISNTREAVRTAEGDFTRVHFAPTLPLSSYLVAFAVGSLDVVVAEDAPPNGIRKVPLPIRAVTTKGHGAQVAYALGHTAEILALLEQFFGLPYPYDKLDIISVPGMDGAMENAAALTFADGYLEFDEKTVSVAQRREYAATVAHELAHQWVGDLVTAAWWDDIWLNEAFATWLEAKVTDLWDPSLGASRLRLESMHLAMLNDGLASARSIRQPIESTDDIENAFDAITYQKGGRVLTMFERFVGPETFRRGVRNYIVEHSFGAATADDFLNAASAASGRDLKAAFDTFLNQSGIPFVEAEVRCDGSPRLHVKQSRYLPTGSKGDPNRSWQIPICARYRSDEGPRGIKDSCTLLTTQEGDLPLGGICPEWVFPNADAAGYFRFSLAAKDLSDLRTKGIRALNVNERVALGASLAGAVNQGKLSLKDALLAASTLADDPHPDVADAPMDYVREARDWLYADPVLPHVESYGRKLFHGAFKKLGFTHATADDENRVELRASVVTFLGETARDPEVRAEARRRALMYLGYRKDGAIHKDALDANILGTALIVAGEDADRPLWDAMLAALTKTEDELLREGLLVGLSSSSNLELVELARGLTFDPRLRPIERLIPIRTQMSNPRLRDGTWEWVKGHEDKLLAVAPIKTSILRLVEPLCDEPHAKDVEDFFGPARLANIEGGPRTLASSVEKIRLCAADRAAHEASAREFFSKQ